MNERTIRFKKLAELFARLSKTKAFSIALSYLPTLLVSIFPIVFLYCKNTTQLVADEVAVITLAYLLLSLIVYVPTLLFSKNVHFSSLFSFVFVLLFCNFSVIQAIAALILPNNAALLAAILYALLLGSLSYLLIKNRKSDSLAAFQKLATVVFALLIVWNLVSLIPFDKLIPKPEKRTVAAVASAQNSEPTITLEPNSSNVDLDYATLKTIVTAPGFNFRQFNGKFSSAKKPEVVTKETRAALVEQGTVKPNVYWIILDEAADFYTMQKYYDYDCSGIESFLLDRGFNISYDSHNRIAMSNEALADLCSLNYVSVEDMYYKVALYYRLNGELWHALNNLGYDVYQASSEPSYLYSLRELTDISRQETLFSATTMEGRTQLDLAIDSTPLSLFNIDMLNYTVSSKRLRVERVFEYLKQPENTVYGSSSAIFSHIMCPHCPFVFDRNGGKVDKRGNFNWEDLRYYTEQYAYTMSEMEKIVAQLIENDPNCIIILQSDHGPRSRSDTRRAMKFNIAEEDMRRIFNAVYFGGQPLNIDGLTGVNTLRTVLNALGSDYPLLPNDPDVIPYPYYKNIVDSWND